MAKVKSGSEKKTATKKKTKVCNSCKKELIVTKFYNSKSPLFADGKLSMCKDCVKASVDYTNMDTIYAILTSMDAPFIIDYWKRAEKSKGDVFGNYIRMANTLNQLKDLRWKDSVFENKLGIESEIERPKKTKITKEDFTFNDIGYEDLVDKWGYGYSEKEYYFFEKKYRKLIDNYGQKTSLHTEALINYIRFRVKEELATAEGDIKAAKEWGSLASTAQKDGKLNVSQLSKSDITGGVELVPQIFEAVESKVGIISILPSLKEQPYDDADLIMWSVVNYLRRLEDKPRIAYKDIWNFYDEMLIDFYKQRGYDDAQIIKEREKRNAIFRDLEEVYREPLYEGED